MPTEDRTFLVDHERLRSVMQQSPLAVSVVMINAVGTVAVLATKQDAWPAAVWLAAMVLVSAARWIGVRRFVGQPPTRQNLRHGVLLNTGGAFVTGALWGIGTIVFFPASDTHQFFLALLIGGMCAGAVSANAAHLPTVMAFILPSSLPLAACFFVEGPRWRISALIVIIFAAVLLAVGRATNRLATGPACASRWMRNDAS
jgi:hypothetical protein